MNKKTIISVIIPTYNRAKYLPEALNSVLNQKNHDYELDVIVIDDKSTDNTVEMLERDYKDKITLIKLPKNTGRPAMVRNAGMKVAKGEFIAFQDSDDVWAPRKFARQMQAFDDPNVVISYGNCDYITADGTVIDDRFAINIPEPVQGYAFARKVSKQPAPMPTPTVIIRRDVIDKIGVFNEKLVIATDTDYFIRVTTLGDVVYCNKVLVHMRRDGSNISSRPDESGDKAVYKHELNRITMFEHLHDELELSEAEKAMLTYRIAELKLEVAITARMLDRNIPVDINELKMPPKPNELKYIDKTYGQKLVGPIKESLLWIFRSSPKHYVSTMVLFKRMVRNLRRS